MHKQAKSLKVKISLIYLAWALYTILIMGGTVWLCTKQYNQTVFIDVSYTTIGLLIFIVIGLAVSVSGLTNALKKNSDYY
jgi:hypothetical protein